MTDLQMVQRNGLNILIVQEVPSKEVQMAAVKHTGRVIRYINNHDRDVQLAAVDQDKYAIKYITNPDKEVLAMVPDGLDNTKYHNGLDKTELLHRVHMYGFNIRYITDPDEDIQMAAVKHHINNFMYIDEPHPNVLEYVLLALMQERERIKSFDHSKK